VYQLKERQTDYLIDTGLTLFRDLSRQVKVAPLQSLQWLYRAMIRDQDGVPADPISATSFRAHESLTWNSSIAMSYALTSSRSSQAPPRELSKES